MEVVEGEGVGEVGVQNSVPSVALPKQQSHAAIGFHGPLFLNSTNFNLLSKLLIGFFLLTCWAIKLYPLPCTHMINNAHPGSWRINAEFRPL